VLTCRLFVPETKMIRSTLAASTLILLCATPLAARLGAFNPAIVAAVADPHRTEANRLRDKYRHPIETLSFFGVKPEQTLVEYSPGGGWYTEILAPLLHQRGHYIGLDGGTPKAQANLTKILTGGGTRYAGATAASIDFATGKSNVAPGSADVVLTFRNVHNLIFAGPQTAPRVFAAFFTMLKPGGTLGVVDHRLPASRDSALEQSSGYLKRSTVVKLATAAGFRLVAVSQINANPKDKADYPNGVWTLPPTLTEGEKNRAHYLAIGESDRMTLKFIKPH
jgi:predicted methyltransferase